MVFFKYGKRFFCGQYPESSKAVAQQWIIVLCDHGDRYCVLSEGIPI